MNQAALYSAAMTLGQRIQAARKRLNPVPTQQKIGDAFGITDKAVSAWERDETVPDADKFPKLARILRVPTNWLIEGKGSPPSPTSLEARVDQLSPNERALLEFALDMIEKQRDNAA